MKAVMVMFDTLTKDFLSTYGSELSKTPNFKRLEETCCVMDNFYGGSMPCMPARRELHTGKYNFLHRSWGPLEPFDFSAIQQLSDNGIYTHLCTDHSHYFEDGGATYHNRYCTWEGFRGQEGDRWAPRDIQVDIPKRSPFNKKGISIVQHEANKTRMNQEETYSGVKTMTAGIEFLKSHIKQDNWFLQIETFDPHEPFYVPQTYRDAFGLYDKPYFNWPAYAQINTEKSAEEIEELRREYAALLYMCDTYLGQVLDVFDANNMWDDTMLIVNTDHGFLLGEHDYMGKNFWPMHQEIIHIPFYIHVPRESIGRRSSLCGTIDIAPTLLDFFGCEIPANMEGISLLGVVKNDEKIHDFLLFGTHGGHVNITDGSYVFMKAAANKENTPYVECTLMPTHIRGFMSRDALLSMELQVGNKFTNNIPYLKMKSQTYLNSYMFGDSLWDVRNKEEKIVDLKRQEVLMRELIRIMKSLDAPNEEFMRLGLHYEK